MRSALAAALLVLTACPPPPATSPDDAADTEPSIRVIYPPQGAEIPLEDDCTLTLLVVTAVENVRLIDPIDTNGPQEGQGHWHLELPGGGYQKAVDEHVQVEGLVLPPNQTQIFGIALHDNVHQPIAGPTSQTNLEVRVVDPPGIECP